MSVISYVPGRFLYLPVVRKAAVGYSSAGRESSPIFLLLVGLALVLWRANNGENRMNLAVHLHRLLSAGRGGRGDRGAAHRPRLAGGRQPAGAPAAPGDCCATAGVLCLWIAGPDHRPVAVFYRRASV